MIITGRIVKCPPWTNLDWSRRAEEARHRPGTPRARTPYYELPESHPGWPKNRTHRRIRRRSSVFGN